MQQNLPWRHTIFNLDKFEPTGSSIKENERILYSNHSYKLANYYKNHRNFKNVLDIKSTVFGMGKADYPDELIEKADSLSFYKVCIHGIILVFNNLFIVSYKTSK